MTSGTYRTYFDIAQWGLVHRAAAAALGKTPRQLWESEDFDVFDLLVSVELPAPGEARATFRAGITMEVSYVPDTLTVTRVATYFESQLAEEWSGAMTLEEFLSGARADDVHGTDGNDWLYVRGTGSMYGGGGNDILELQDRAVAWGGSGSDTFVVHGRPGSHVRIADYRPGERIVFTAYGDFWALAGAFAGVSGSDAHGFTLNFGGGWHGSPWSLRIEGATLDQMRLEDLLVGQAAYDQILAPVYSAFGIV